MYLPFSATFIIPNIMPVSFFAVSFLQFLRFFFLMSRYFPRGKNNSDNCRGFFFRVCVGLPCPEGIGMEGAFQKALKMKFTVTVELLIRPWVQRTQLTSWIVVIFFFQHGSCLQSSEKPRWPLPRVCELQFYCCRRRFCSFKTRLPLRLR